MQNLKLHGMVNVRRVLVCLMLLVNVFIPIQNAEAKPASRETIFRGIEFNELLTTIIEEYKKLGFEFKSSEKTEFYKGFNVEVYFDYLPRITKDDRGGTNCRLVITEFIRGDEVVFNVALQGILFSKSIIVSDEGDAIRRSKAFDDLNLGLSNVKISLKKYYVADGKSFGAG